MTGARMSGAGIDSEAVSAGGEQADREAVMQVPATVQKQ